MAEVYNVDTEVTAMVRDTEFEGVKELGLY